MTTANDLVQETRRHLFSGSREELNQVGADYNAGDPTITLAHSLGGIRKGAMLAIDLELLYVFDVAGSVATVIGSQLGTSPANHVTNAVVTVNPRYSDFAIFTALNEELLSLSSPTNGLFQVKPFTITFDGAVRGYDFAADVLDVIGIAAKDGASAAKFWPAITRFKVERSMDPTQFPSGTALILYETGYQGSPVQVRYKAPFTTFTNLASTLASTGLPESAKDIPPLGAAARLVAPREVKRNQTESQGDSRRAEEVPAGANIGSYRNLMAARQVRINEEAARLRQMYPIEKR